VSSGKTYVSLMKYAWFVGQSPSNHEFMICGKSLTALRRNCIGMLSEMCGKYFTCTMSTKQGWMFGRRIHFEGASDERSENKIRGITLGGAYCDEITLYPETFVNMLLSRLREPGAKLYATANPDHPKHYIKEKLIDNKKLDLAHWQFVIDDNTFLDPYYVEQIKREYTGVFYERYILGRWVVAEGLIYPMFDPAVHVVPTEPRRYERFWVSIDYGIQNATSMGLWGVFCGVFYRICEYYHSGRDTGRQLTDDELYVELERITGGENITRVIVDPSAASFITLIRRKGRFRVQNADNSVIDGISETASALKSGIIRINNCCRDIIREFAQYRWDEKAGVDRPIKENDHAMDDLRYFVKTMQIAIPKRKGFIL